MMPASNNNKTTIFESYHKPTQILESKILKPIHVGRKISNPEIRKKMENMIGDDTGDNISDKNQTFCELTATYWAWKNDDSDVVGFFHYRRHLAFTEEKLKENDWGTFEYPVINEFYINHTGLKDQCIEQYVQNYDLIVPRAWNVEKAGSSNNYEHYKNSNTKLHIEDYDRALKLLVDKYPEYKEDIREYNESKFGYYTNMFVMKRGMFEEYCAILFDVLFSLEKEIDISSYDVQERRVFGYISEWLFGIYVTHQKHNNNIKIKELLRSFVNNPDVDDSSKNIISCCDNNYARHLGTLITSVKINTEEKINYWILHSGLSSENIEKFKQLEDKRIKIILMEFDIKNVELVKNTMYTNPHVSVITYVRLFISMYVPKEIEKILYLDCDMICNSEIDELLNKEFGDNIVLGVEDVLSRSNMDRLKINKYINAGMLMIDLKKWRNEDCISYFVDYMEENVDNKNKLFYHDQDIINSTLERKIGYIENKWNAQTSSYPGCEKQNEIGKNAAIIHFISDRKPWIAGSGSPFVDLYEKYLKLSPWKEEPTIIANVNKKKSIKTKIIEKCEKGFSYNIHKKRYGLKYKLGLFSGMVLNSEHVKLLAYDEYKRKNHFSSWYIFSIKKRAKKNGPIDEIVLARCYRDGDGVKKDLQQTWHWYLKAVTNGTVWVSPELYDTAWALSDQEKYKEAVKWCTKDAESGNIHSMVRLARAYRDGCGVDRNISTSINWYAKALNGGADWIKDETMDLVNKIGINIEDKNQYPMSISLLKCLSENGSTISSIRIARCYRDGDGVKKDLQQTWHWYLKAVTNGTVWVSPELYDTAWALSDQEKYKEAVKWCTKDAESGNIHSMVRLARAYRDGCGVDRNISTSINWYAKALNGGADWIKDEYESVKNN